MLLGTDWSHWQGYSSVQQAREAGIEFFFFKSTEGLYFVDSKFENFRTQAEQLKVPWGAYHFFRPTYDPVQQAKHFYKVVGKYTGLPPVIDFETADGVSKDLLNKRFTLFAKEVTSLFGRTPIIYTRGYFWNYWMYTNSSWAKYPLWVAHYGAVSPYLPREWKSYLFWQYSETGSGKTYGVSSPYVDLNKTPLTKEELYKFAGLINTPEPTPEPPIVVEDEEDNMLKMKCTASTLNVRSAPSVFASKVGYVSNGDAVDVYAVGYGSGLSWAKISRDKEQWVAIKYLVMR